MNTLYLFEETPSHKALGLAFEMSPNCLYAKNASGDVSILAISSLLDAMQAMNIITGEERDRIVNRSLGHNHGEKTITDPAQRTQFNYCGVCKDWFYPTGK